MIDREDLVKIGHINKPHGIKGELNCSFSNIPFENIDDIFFIFELDGIFVPFLLDDYRINSHSSAYIKLKNINTDLQAKLLNNKDIYFPKKDVVEEIEIGIDSWDFFIGYTLLDEKYGMLGEIIDVDDTTINVLFVIRKEDKEFLIPANENILLSFDQESKILYSSIPEGLINI